VKLYVCWDARPKHPIIGEHPCGTAYEALREAGYDPEVVKTYGSAKLLPSFLNLGRKRVRELSGGNEEVPLLELDDGEVIQGSGKIISWAGGHPASSA
jgi:hypothetical protein